MCRGRAWLNLSVGWFFYPRGSHLSPLGCLWAVWSLLISPAAITNRNNSQIPPLWRHLMSVPINKTFQRTHRRADCICYPPLCTCLSLPFFCGIVRLPFYPPLTNECSQDSSRSPLDAMRDARENRQHSVFSFGVLGHQVVATDRFFFFFFNEYVSSSAQTGQPVDATVCLWGEEYKKGRQPQTAKVMAMASARTQLDSSFHGGWTSPGSSQAFTQFWTEHRV